MFSMLDESVQSQVTLGTDSKVSVMGKGDVNVLTRLGVKKSIADEIGRASCRERVSSPV